MTRRRLVLAAVAAGTVAVLTSGVSSAAPRSIAAGATSQDAIAVQALNGRAGGETGTAQGSDQGEDQGENIGQSTKGSSPFGKSTVKAHNSIRSGKVGGGNGGAAMVIFDNYVTTTCSGGTPGLVPLPETVDVKSGNGGAGGASGHAQGSDQGEDQGENIGQFSAGLGGLRHSAVAAVNAIRSEAANGGDGGPVSVVFNTFTTCAGSGLAPAPTPHDSSKISSDTFGNVTATFTTHSSCIVSTPQAYLIEAGNGGVGGSSGKEQGADQGEDQGENIGQFSVGSDGGHPTTVLAPHNTLRSLGANGGRGGDVTVTFENYIDLTCASPGPAAGASGSVTVEAGSGGSGGETGTGQGSDQGEDQGENIGQFATKGGIIGPVTVKASNTIRSGTVTGGAGGNVSVVYNDVGTCSAGKTPSATVDERAVAAAGAGGRGGASGTDQGADQGEDQGENIGQFAFGGGRSTVASVKAQNTNIAGNANGGAGGSVAVAYDTGSCSVPLAYSNQGTAAIAGNGGAGGVSGMGQGADQGEDQGENIVQFSKGAVAFHAISVRAVNRNISADAIGGSGGSVAVGSGASPCVASAATPDPRVAPTTGVGGGAGKTGEGQGSDQGEDQGENIGLLTASFGQGPKVWAANSNRTGKAQAGVPGTLETFSCAATSPPPPGVARSTTRPAAIPEVTGCHGRFRGATFDLIVASRTSCVIKRGARITHNVEVDPGATVVAVGAFTIGHDFVSTQAKSIRISGGSIGHDLAIESPGFAGKPGVFTFCGVKVKHNILVEGAATKGERIVVGDPRRCSGNRAGGDIAVEANVGRVFVRGNRSGHDVNCFENGSLAARGNHAAHANNCPAPRR